MKRITKQKLMMNIAEEVAKRSTCERLQVGTVITDRTMKEIKAYGYNGNYSGGPNYCDRKGEGNCLCVHSEINALIKPGRISGEIMFVNYSPCISCSKAIINSGIKKVFYRNAYRDTSGLRLLKKAGIKVIKFLLGNY